MIDYMKTKMKIEFKAQPIRHISIQCPDCKNWFVGNDIAIKRPEYSFELESLHCRCPKCDHEFEADPEVEETNSENVYRLCLKKKIVWEK